MNKLKKILICLMVIANCWACKSKETIKVGEYLDLLANLSGTNVNEVRKDNIDSLIKWGIISSEESKTLDDDLTYNLLSNTVSRFIDGEDNPNYLYEKEFVDLNYKPFDSVDKDIAKDVLYKLIDIINNPIIEENNELIFNDGVIELEDYEINFDSLITQEILSKGDIVYLKNDNYFIEISKLDDGSYKFKEAQFDEVYKDINISGDFEVDFSKSELDNYDSIKEDDSLAYVNNKFDLLSSTNRKKFSKDGYDISYSLKNKGIDLRISKNVKDGVTMYYDLELSNVKPKYKWNNEGENLDAFFKVDFDIINEIGISTGKYNNYYLDFKDLDSSSFLNKVKSSINTKKDALEATIPICTIKTPIPNIPTANFNIDIVAKFYASGEVRILVNNNGVLGYEIKDGKFRLVKDIDSDADFIIGASARSVVGLNFNLCSSKYRLMDIEFDAGIRAAVSSTLHLYDKEGNIISTSIDEDYSTLYEISKENDEVDVCGDVTLNWVFDINLNTSKTLLYKYGFSKTTSVLTKKNQVFNNLTHIENFEFVKSCSRKAKKKINNATNTTSNSKVEKLELSKYSLVIIINNEINIPIKSIPSSYSQTDLIYSSDNSSIASIDQSGTIHANNLGTAKIKVSTKDDKHFAYLTVLVSTG